MSSPLITSLSPSYGSMSGGYSLTIIGDFSGTLTSVTINGISCTITSNSTTEIIVTVPSSSVQDNVYVIVTTDIGSTSSIFTYSGKYYVNKLYVPGSNWVVISIKVDIFNNVYFLVKKATTTWSLLVYSGTTVSEIDYGTLGSGTIVLLDMMLISNVSNTYLYLLYSDNSVSFMKKFSVSFISSISLSLLSSLEVTSAKFFISNITNNDQIYLIGTIVSRGIILISSFSTVTNYITSQIFNSATYKSDGYIYGISNSWFYELDISTLSTSSASSQTSIAMPASTSRASIVLWVNNPTDTDSSGFYVIDNQSSGATGIGNDAGFYNGQIYQYMYPFSGGSNNTGIISDILPSKSNLIIRGNSGSGSSYVTLTTGNTTINDNTYSNILYGDSGTWSFTKVIGYNINGSGYTNLFIGAGNLSYPMILSKLYNPTYGSNTGGDPHIKTIDGKHYILPSDHVNFQLFKYANKDVKIFVNCKTRFLTRENHPIGNIEFVMSNNGVLEYWNDTIDSMFEQYERYKENIEITYLDKIYINYNEDEITIDMDTLEVIGDIDKFLIEDYDNNGEGIYSVTYNRCLKKTKYTKHKKIYVNIDENRQVLIILGSDYSIIDMNNISIQVKGLDSDLVDGCIKSVNNVVKLNELTQLK